MQIREDERVPGADRALNAREAAELLGGHVETIRRLARKGGIPSYKVGKDWRFSEVALRHWAETHHLRSERRTVLVVDDEEDIRILVRRALEREGYSVVVAADGAEALDIARAQPLDVVVLDLLMPGMDGPAVLGELRRIAEDAPVIILTGYPDGELMARALEFSPVTLVAKPARLDKIVEAVRSVSRGQPRESATSV